MLVAWLLLSYHSAHFLLFLKNAVFPHLQEQPGLGRARNCPATSPSVRLLPPFPLFFKEKIAVQYKPFPQPSSSGIPAQVEALINLKMFLEGEMNENVFFWFWQDELR